MNKKTGGRCTTLLHKPLQVRFNPQRQVKNNFTTLKQFTTDADSGLEC